MVSLHTLVWLLPSISTFISTSAQFEAAEPAHSIRHNQMLCDWLTCTPMILNFRQAPPPRESKRLSIMPFQNLSTKQSEVAEFGITRLHQIILKQFLKDHVTLKTGLMTAKNSALPSQE